MPPVAADLAEAWRLTEALIVAWAADPDRRVTERAARHGIAAVALAEGMAEYAVSHRAYLNDGYRAEVPLAKGHWIEHGNRVAADLTARRLCAASSALAGPAY